MGVGWGGIGWDGRRGFESEENIQVNHNRQATNNCIMGTLSLKPHPSVEPVSSKRHGLTVWFCAKCQDVSCGTRGMEK